MRIVSGILCLLALAVVGSWWLAGRQDTAQTVQIPLPRTVPISAALQHPIRQHLSVSAAYRAIPHRQTAFDATRAQMSVPVRDYLARLFHLTDLAMVERVQTLQAFRTGRHASGAPEEGNYPVLLARLQALTPPPELKDAHRLILEAVNEQRAYFAEWRARGGRFQARHPLVQSAHRKLIQAYNVLMRHYPNETAHNRRAFFDHLCALDFI